MELLWLVLWDDYGWCHEITMIAAMVTTMIVAIIATMLKYVEELIDFPNASLE